MAKGTPSVLERRDLLDQHLTSLSLLIKEWCPDGELDISLTRYEDEDAHVRIFPPDTTGEEERNRLADRLADRTLDILSETGLLILTGVYEPAQRPKH